MTSPSAAAPRPPFDVVVLAASSGGVRALRTVVAGLPADFTTPVLVVQHRSPGPDDLLTEILRTSTALPVHRAAPGPLTAGVHVFPPRTSADLTAEGSLALDPCDSGRCADRSMASAAAAFGPRVLAVVLTGRLSDGAEGVRSVGRAGGRVLTQDPADAEAPS